MNSDKCCYKQSADSCQFAGIEPMIAIADFLQKKLFALVLI